MMLSLNVSRTILNDLKSHVQFAISCNAARSLFDVCSVLVIGWFSQLFFGLYVSSHYELLGQMQLKIPLALRNLMLL